MQTYEPTLEDEVYTPSGVTSHYNQVVHTYIPTNTPMPSAGRPCLIVANNSGFTSTSYLDELDPYVAGVQYLAYRRGWVVRSAKTTVSNQTITSGGSAITGKGFWKRIASSLWTSTAFIEKDGPLLVQNTRYNAAALGVNPSQVYIMGRSAGAAAAAAAAMMPDFSLAGTAWGMYDGVSSRPNGCILRSFPMAYVPGASGSTLITNYCAHFADNTSAASNAYDTAAVSFGTGGTQANTATQSGASALQYGFNRAADWYLDVLNPQQASIDLLNAKQNFYIYSIGDSTTVESVNFDDGADWNHSSNPSDNPYISVPLTSGYLSTPALTETHSAWNMYAMREALREIGVRWGVGGGRSRCCTTPNMDNYVANNSPTGWTGVERKLATSTGGFDDPVELDMMQWLEEQLAYG